MDREMYMHVQNIWFVILGSGFYINYQRSGSLENYQ